MDKMIRVQANYDKRIDDAACVATDIAPALRTNQPLEVKANGHGNRQNVRMNKYGFPCSAKNSHLKIGRILLKFSRRNKGLK